MVKKSELILGIMVVLMFSTVCMETDIYVPAFPIMKDYFLIGDTEIQYVIIYNFIGICLGSLFFGPFSDSFGRLKTLRIGLFIFAISSWGCVYFSNYNLFLLSRFIQGIGAAAPMVASFAILLDKYDTKKVSQLCGVLNVFIAGIMAFSPMLGSILVLYFDWRLNFTVIAVLATTCLVGSIFFIEESLSIDQMKKFSPKSILKDILKMFASLHYMFGNLIGYFMFAIILIFIANLSIIFIDYMGVSQEIYGWYQSMIMGSFALTSVVSPFMIGKFGTRKTKFIGLIIAFIGISLLTIFHDATPFVICSIMALYTVGGTFAMVIYCVEAVAVFPNLKGVASGLSNALRHLSIGFLVSVGAGFFDGSIKPIAYIAAALCILVALMAYFIEKVPLKNQA